MLPIHRGALSCDRRCFHIYGESDGKEVVTKDV